jgi:hypothetical protein
VLAELVSFGLSVRSTASLPLKPHPLQFLRSIGSSVVDPQGIPADVIPFELLSASASSKLASHPLKERNVEINSEVRK